MKNYFFFLMIFMIPNVCSAQTDTSYIRSFEQRFAVRAYLMKNFIMMNYEPNEGPEQSYLPNNPVNIGLGLRINNTVFDFGYGYGFDFFRGKELGKTKALDFQLHNYGRKIVWDLFIQRYQGFYREESTSDDITLCPDLKIRQYGLHGQYILNNKKFSYRAAFNQSEKQLKSAGSFLVGAGIYFTKIESDTSFVIESKKLFNNFQFGVSGGYTYTWVLGDHWYINASATVGINFGSDKINTFGKQKLEVYPTVFPRFAAGYNKNKYSVILSYVGNVVFPAISDNSSLGVCSGNVQLCYIYRFDLKRR